MLESEPEFTLRAATVDGGFVTAEVFDQLARPEKMIGSGA